MRRITVSIDGYEVAASAVTRRAAKDDAAVEAGARAIIADVAARGDQALLELGRRFDCPELTAIEVSTEEWEDGVADVSHELLTALKAAAASIRRFHEPQRRQTWMDARPGCVTGQVLRPLGVVGLYVPGGTAVYPSSVLMCGIPAAVAGVGQIVMCTPCGRNGRLNPAVLAAARIAGVSRIFKVGGAQAVAAMALGTATVPRVDKIAGPGNAWVTAAKRLLWGVVDIDMLAGPSEVCVVADSEANPAFVAADLMTQAEHDPDCAAFLITPSADLAEAVNREIESLLEAAPRRKFLETSLNEHSAIVVTSSLEEAVDLANVCAPEHLALMVRDPYEALSRVHNAGAVLMGDYSPQTLGDYMAGPSHTLPTSGTARFSSPLNVDTFMKKMSFIHYSGAALADVADSLVTLATAEGFAAHAAAVEIRRAQ